jgi:hypothetical protein
MSLFAFSHFNPDFGFLQFFRNYQSAASLVENEELPIDPDGFVILPNNLKSTSLTGRIFVIKDSGIVTIYFPYDSETSDGFSWGYLYRSDGSAPASANNLDRNNCYFWRAIVPPKAKWYYCEVHPIYGFPDSY